MTLCGCFAGLALSAADMMRPDDSTGKMLKAVFALVFAAVFVSPLTGICSGEYTELPEYDASVITQEELETAVMNDIAVCSGKNISEETAHILDSRSVPHGEIYADVNIDEDNSINISKIYIASERFDDAREAVREELGNDIDILRYDEYEGHDK